MAEVSVQKRGDKWRYRFDVAKIDGKRSQISKGGYSTKKEAMAQGIKALAAYNKSGILFTPSEISFNDYLDFWMKEYCVPNLKPETVKHYEKKIRIHIKPVLGKYKLKLITPAVIQGIINDLFNKGYARNTLVVIKGILSGCFRYAIEPLKFISSSPVDHIRIPSYRAKADVPTRSSPHVYVTKEKIAEIFKRFPCGCSSYIPLQFGYRCGMRIGEAYAVAWDDIDFKNKTINICRQIQWDSSQMAWYFTDPKYDSFRTIDMDATMADILYKESEQQLKDEAYYGERYVRLYESDNRILNTDGNGKRIRLVTIRRDGSYITARTMQHTSSVIHHQMGFPEFDFHSLRHTHATMLAEADAPVKYVQARLGHKNVQVTLQVYQHLTDMISQQGVVALDQIYE